jgi:phenylalanyl-tRNA synthetase beta chain
MNIRILHSWLLEYLETTAKPEEIAKYLSLCGPSVEKLEKIGSDYIYDIEITTNRVDTASVYGIAREASAILPRFGYKTRLKPLEFAQYKVAKEGAFPIIIKADKKDNNRIMAVLIKNISNKKTPDYIKTRLETAGIRSLDAVVDITNYVMTEIGHPTHVFDYDRLTNNKIICRESRKGEKIVGLDDKTYILLGGDIVFDDGTGKIIDLPGILGTKNSVVTPNTKNILFFIDNNNAAKTRKTSMSLSIRSVAATLNEKGVDPELGTIALAKGIELYQKVCGGEVDGDSFDQNLKPYKPKTISVGLEFVNKSIGVSINKSTIIDILTNLGFTPQVKGNSVNVTIPSWRATDIYLPEDIVEEIARIYGYFNLPSVIMTGALPEPIPSSPFAFEDHLKDLLTYLDGIEIYTSSLVSLKEIDKNALKIKNPLGFDGEYLRTSLFPGLSKSTLENGGNKPFFMFEISHIYLPKTNDLPEEVNMLGGIFYQTDYKIAKGKIEEILLNLGMMPTFKVEEDKDYKPSSSVYLYVGDIYIGRLGITNDNLVYFEFEMKKLIDHIKTTPYIPKSKFPPQIEDLTFDFPERTYLGEVYSLIKKVRNLTLVELKDTFEKTATFRVYYQNETKTLNNNEVKNIRNIILHRIKSKFGGKIKD